jgi:hypothetical protein
MSLYILRKYPLFLPLYVPPRRNQTKMEYVLGMQISSHVFSVLVNVS